MTGVVDVMLWGTKVGSLGYAPGQNTIATFEYEPDFMKSGIQISPIHVRYPPNRFSFDQLNPSAFMGLPGFFADSLPDKYGNQLIDLYMADKNIPPDQITALDRLYYVADRGMGALEYKPGEYFQSQETALDIHKLAELS